MVAKSGVDVNLRGLAASGRSGPGAGPTGGRAFGLFWTGKRQTFPVTMASAVREQYRFGVIVGERVIEPGLDDRGRWRIGTAMHPHPFFPQAEMAQDLFDDGAVVDERNNPHLVGTTRTHQRIRLPHLFDEFAPLGRGDTARFVFGDIDDLHGPARGGGLFDGVFVALAAHLVAVPAVIPDELEALVWDVLGDGGDKVARGEHFKVTLNLGVLAGAVDNGAATFFDLHLFHGEGVADDVLGEPFEVFALVGLDAVAAMHVEAGVDPAAQHPGAFGREESLFEQEGNDTRPEHFFERLEGGLGGDMELAGAHEQAVGDKGVKVGVKVEILAEGVDGHDDAGQAVGQIEHGALILGQALVGDPAQVFEQVAVVTEVNSQHLGQGEGEVPVGYWE